MLVGPTLFGVGISEDTICLCFFVNDAMTPILLLLLFTFLVFLFVISEHHVIKTAPLSYSISNGSQFLNESSAKLFACVATQSHSVRSYLFEVLHPRTFPLSLRSSADTHMLKLQRFNPQTHGFRTFSHFGPHV